jgi:hypothetical protein
MSLKSAPYYWVECDRCGIKASEGCDIEAWRQDWAAYDDASNADFKEVQQGSEATLHFCIDCAEKLGMLDE